MTPVNSDLFQKFSRAKRFPAEREGNGSEVEVDVREDEEQKIKFQEIIDLLVAAGYFRARIKGLSPFDKVVGGMTWCIESCNIDVDVDLLFQENSTIGQKIALTEKIVVTLPKMKCPHLIEPHQIQGLDFIHIFPVIQWLVKRSMEFRQEMSEFVRLYAINQFNKHFGLNDDESKLKTNIFKNLNAVKEVYKPRRSYKKKNVNLPDINMQVQVTLLEYGYRGGDLQSVSHNESGNNESVLEIHKNQEQQIQQLLNNLTISKEELFDHEDLNEEDLMNLAKHYESLQLEFKNDGIKLQEEKQLLVVGEQIRTLSERCGTFDSDINFLEKALKDSSSQLQETRLKQEESDKKLMELEEHEINQTQNVKEVEELVILNENLRAQEMQFKEYCKKELTRIQNLIEKTKKIKLPVEDNKKLNVSSEELTKNVKALRLHLGKKNRSVATLQRHIDDVPNRPELAQYQRRFLELYNQVSAKHRETKQYYTLYNTLEDSKFYMKKELSLLNSISDSYPEALQSSDNKEEFLKQFQNIVEGVKQSKEKVEKKLLEERRTRDLLSSALQNLVEQQRKYVAAVRQLTIECKKHENLLSQHKF